MVKSLADELTDMLNWVENPGLGKRAAEEATTGLVIFCRGLVCGLRGGLPVTDDTPCTLDKLLRKQAAEHEEAKVDARFRSALRPAEEDMRVRPSIEEALKDPGCIPDCH